MKCFFCKSEGEGKTLMKNALKLVRTRYKDVTQNDTFCNSCYQKIQLLLKRTVAKRRLASTAISATSSMNNDTSSSSSSRSYTIDDSLDRLLIEAERNNATNQTTNSLSLNTIQALPSTESNVWSMSIASIPQKRRRIKQEIDIPNVRPILPSDSDDSVSISDEVPGPSSLANVQPLIRRRRKPIIFADEKIVPIYNRRHYGG